MDPGHLDQEPEPQEPQDTQIQECIRSLRETMGMTQEKLAWKMGLTVRTIARYENDSPPKGDALAKFRDLALDYGRQDLAIIFMGAQVHEVASAFEDFASEWGAGEIFRAIIFGLSKDILSGEGYFQQPFRQQLLKFLEPTMKEMYESFLPPPRKPKESEKKGEKEL
jgi:transcriptional regulator with XRE-family HTH domain